MPSSKILLIHTAAESVFLVSTDASAATKANSSVLVAEFQQTKQKSRKTSMQELLIKFICAISCKPKQPQKKDLLTSTQIYIITDQKLENLTCWKVQHVSLSTTLTIKAFRSLDSKQDKLQLALLFFSKLNKTRFKLFLLGSYSSSQSEELLHYHNWIHRGLFQNSQKSYQSFTNFLSDAASWEKRASRNIWNTSVRDEHASNHRNIFSASKCRGMCLSSFSRRTSKHSRTETRIFGVCRNKPNHCVQQSRQPCMQDLLSTIQKLFFRAQYQSN